MAVEVLEQPKVTLFPMGEDVYGVTSELYKPVTFEHMAPAEVVEDLGSVVVQNELDELRDTPQISRIQDIKDRVVFSPKFEWLTDHLGKAAVPAAAASLLVPVAATANSSEKTAKTAQQAPVIIEQKTTHTIEVGNSSMTDSDFSKATVLGNHRTISAAKMKKAEKNGDCVTLDGKKTKIWTQGHGEKGKPFGIDTRTSRFCKWGKNWYRKACGNLARFKRPKNAVSGPIVWVNNFAKAKLRLVAKSEAKAQAECKTGGATAFAYGTGSGEASVNLNIRKVLKVKGRLQKFITRESLEASGEASSYAKADARCETQSTTTTTTTVETKPKPTPIPTATPTVTPTPTPTVTPTPTPEHKPPTSRGDVEHRNINSTGNVCVDPDSPHGFLVKVRNFVFKRTGTNIEVGQKGTPFTVQGTDIECVPWTAPGEPMSVTWTADLDDQHGGTAQHIDEFPVLEIGAKAENRFQGGHL